MQDPDLSQKDKEPGGWGVWKALPAGPLSICMPLEETGLWCVCLSHLRVLAGLRLHLSTHCRWVYSCSE